MSLESIKGNFSNYIEYLNESYKTKVAEGNVDTNIFATSEQNSNQFANISANELINDEDFIKTFDKDDDKQISTEKLQTFIDAVDEMDGQSDNLSFVDFFNGITQIITGSFFSNKAEKIETAIQELNTNIKQNEEQKIDNSGTTSKVNIGHSGTMSKSNSESSITAVNLDINEWNLKQMGTEELKNELATASNTLEAKKEELTKIQTGENDTLKALEQNINQTYEKYQEQVKLVDEKLAEKVDETKNNIDAKDSEIRQNDSAISSQKSSVSTAENQYENAKNNTKLLKDKLSALTGKLGKVIEKIKNKIEQAISSLKSKIQRAEADENRKKSNLEKEKNKLSDLQDNGTKLKNDKTKLENQLSAYQEEIRAKKPQIAQYFQDYQNAKENYAKQKATMIDAAQQTVEAAQTYVNKINTALQVKKTLGEINDTTLKQYDKESGSKILDTIIKNTKTTNGKCLKSIPEAIQQACNSEKKLGTNVTDIAKRLSGNEAGYEDISNNFEEVNIDRSELANLPAGCVVVWEQGIPEPAQGHTAITDGKGGEYSNGYQNSMSYVDSEVGYRVFIPIGLEA